MLSSTDIKTDQDHPEATSRKRPHDEDVTLNTRFDVPAFIATLKDQDMINQFQNAIIPAIDNLEDIDTDPLMRLFAGETNPQTLGRMYQLLRRCTYHDLDHAYITDIMAVFHFMNHEEDVAAMLDILEQKLQDYVASSDAQMYCTEIDDKRRKLIDLDAGQYKCHKVLSHCMYQWAQEVGFERKAKIVAFLTPSSFLNVLTSKAVFKDSAPTINPAHGMWAHTLQWFCVIEHHKITNFLQHKPLELYQQIGKSNSAIWDNVLDSLDARAHDCPEHFSRTIIEGSARWPLLSETMRRQRLKMRETGFFNSTYKNHLYEKHNAEAENGVVYKPF